ncbi:hypothetical protein [Roseomonas sp. KE2513]|uniref:hypothetical protein n=1 Tax=Roseomonas sp. KE2513 TaxID=2479202 RepID=UPI0018DF7B2C|nr:hypothetical protein [Roseomonas sp. KE2513]
MRLISAAFALGALLMASALPHAQEVPNPVVIDTGQRTWRIPYLYLSNLSICSPPGPLPAVARVPGFSFAFWMPAGRFCQISRQT